MGLKSFDYPLLSLHYLSGTPNLIAGDSLMFILIGNTKTA